MYTLNEEVKAVIQQISLLLNSANKESVQTLLAGITEKIESSFETYRQVIEKNIKENPTNKGEIINQAVNASVNQRMYFNKIYLTPHYRIFTLISGLNREVNDIKNNNHFHEAIFLAVIQQIERLKMVLFKEADQFLNNLKHELLEENKKVTYADEEVEKYKVILQENLGITNNSTIEDIQIAFKKFSLLNHSDKNINISKEENFRKLEKQKSVSEAVTWARKNWKDQQSQNHSTIENQSSVKREKTSVLSLKYTPEYEAQRQLQYHTPPTLTIAPFVSVSSVSFMLKTIGGGCGVLGALLLLTPYAPLSVPLMLTGGVLYTSGRALGLFSKDDKKTEEASWVPCISYHK